MRLFRRRLPDQTTVLHKNLDNQTLLVDDVAKAKCPRCKRETLRLRGYTNSVSHYEFAVECGSCKGAFVFTDTQFKVEYGAEK